MDETSAYRRYLLGELDESEQEAFETKLMTSDEHFQELLIAEDEIVDDYLAGKLRASEEQSYRDRFLSTPERRRQHRFGEALRKHLSSPGARESPTPFFRTWRLPAAAAAAALIAAGVWSILRSPLRLEETQRVEGSRVAIFLTTGGLRSLEPPTAQTITIPAGVAFVELQLDLPSDARGDHEVALEDARSGAVVAEGILPVQSIEGQFVVVATVPSDLLRAGEYRVILRATSGEGERARETYAFRVTSP